MYLIALFTFFLPVFKSVTAITLSGRSVQLEWFESSNGWTSQLQILTGPDTWKNVSGLEGSYGILSDVNSSTPDSASVKRNLLGQYSKVLPTNVTLSTGSSVTTSAQSANGTLKAVWTINTNLTSDVISVEVTFTPSVSAWYSILSPELATFADSDMAWGVIPGYWTSATIESNDELTFHYNLGAPKNSLITVEASTTTLLSIIETVDGITFGVLADPSLARDPYPSSSDSGQTQWNVGMSLRNRDNSFAPTCWYPVLGQEHSALTAGSPISATFHYLVNDTSDGWYEMNKFVATEVFPYTQYSSRAYDIDSLSDRINRIHDFIVTPASDWHLWTFDNLTLGAESGKLSDVGAMWMMEAITSDPIIENERLPYARNFKLAQQETGGGAFEGAALGEYYKDGAFVSELVWAGITSEPDYVSPIYTTFYTLSDMANIVLFTPDDSTLTSRIKLGADKLLSWQYSNGSFDIGYVRANPTTKAYPELTDYRATWYGFVAAYRILNNSTYLAAAERGANWFIENAINTGNFLGVCDDTLIVRDFHTIFAAQALLDLYDITQNVTYQQAAIQVAKFYTLQIFNHPVVSDGTRTGNGQTLQEWQVSQVGLNFEHAGYYGSVNNNGPILLSSHAGAFIRFYELTNDLFFLDLARIAARGRDAFVSPNSGISSYYWIWLNTGGSHYPWHGWWHIGWLTDYLLSAIHHATSGNINFPRGLATAKVGSHVPYGFADGAVYGTPAKLWIPRNLVNASSPSVDWITARSSDGSKLFVIVLNEAISATTATITLDPRALVPGQVATWGSTTILAGTGSKTGSNTWQVSLVGNYGLTAFEIDASLAFDTQGPEFRNFSITGASKTPLVSWSFWATFTSWVQWKTPSATSWTSATQSRNYTFNTTLNLSSVASGTVEIRIATQNGSDIGYSNPVNWTVSS